MQKTPPSAPRRVLTAHNVFGPLVNFDFLIEKAIHELNLSFAEGEKFFYWNAMNFSVSIHSIADHLWWIKAINDPQWHTCQNNFVNCQSEHCQNNFINWVKTENDCIRAFVDLSNTYKHSHRTRTHKVDSLKLHPDDQIIKNSDPPDELELRNRIIDKAQPKDAVFWPVITVNGRLIYYRYAAESALGWWRQYERQ